MKDQLKNIGAELAATIVERFQSEEVKALLEQTKAAEDSETGTFEVVITTEHLDRYNEVIKLDAWELEHYRNNPVVLWGHDHNQPIGMATSVEITGGKMIAKGKFAPTEKAQEVRRLYDFGIIKATSVGFIVKEQEGNLITKAELLEFSFVSVPANPHALSLAMEKELSVNELVTKGFMVVERAVEQTVTETVPESEAETVIEAVPTEEVTPAEERSFSTKQIAPIVGGLKEIIAALEALDVTSEEPEGVEVPGADDEEARAYQDFSDKRRIIQEASTVLGDVLAEARRAIDAKKAA